MSADTDRRTRPARGRTTDPEGGSTSPGVRYEIRHEAKV